MPEIYIVTKACHQKTSIYCTSISILIHILKFPTILGLILPNSGIASLVVGILSVTTCEKTVSDRSIVTPGKVMHQRYTLLNTDENSLF